MTKPRNWLGDAVPAQETVLACFGKKPRLCIHQLVEQTGLTRGVLRYALIELQKTGMLKKCSEVKGDNVYELTARAPFTADECLPIANGSLPVSIALNEKDAKARIVMLKRMRDRLINEYHPILDVFIDDYSKGLATLDLVRYGKVEEPDEGDDVWSQGNFIHKSGVKT